jgi:hypothetical protein
MINDAVHDAPELESLSIGDVPTWFGLFKPVGWLMVGLPSPALADTLEQTLLAAGWTGAQVLRFNPGESLSQLRAMTDDPGPLADFGHEVTLLRRYVELAQQGYGWCLVKVDDNPQAVEAAAIARKGGATLAVHYRLLTMEELI